MIKDINNYFTSIYYHLHSTHEDSISHQSVRILQMIQKEAEVTVRDIAELLNISHNTASEHIKKLERNGWIKKERDSDDQRKVHIHLTTEGLLVLKKNTELNDKKLQHALNQLTEEEQQLILQAFRLLSEVAK
ncbi:MarR family transcriptional regulator [Lysinibacillus sp. KCTC 33748]|uniref:MarR family winged helix-turn-helix transcriptional regulator n=1 Tax=unclassified Lysinibacillus TaxID=2636778 RepID=UPI0009A5F053|nr:MULTISPECIES: MarR family transcriptional regulator [unclassified Lysinibacillus]OXS74945.1 MarR family transcriptional regulator [Lysinibacillus sp. KCTC 33748]SKB60374.1 DNA-binding transcriptional regulator, MarR family [Lysinibacillus sp. AC-3]